MPPAYHKNASDTSIGENFRDRQREHFDRIIRTKWECDENGHGVCVPTDDGQHWKLSERHIKRWVDQLVKGQGTTATPPPGTFEDIGHGAVWNRRNGTMIVTAVTAPPARIRDSIRSGEGSTMRRDGRSGRTSSTMSEGSAIGRGPGSLVGRALRWFGQKGLNVVEEAAASKQANEHITCFRTWQRRVFPIGSAERRKATIMLEDALEMAKPFFTKRIRRMAYEIGKEAQQWLGTIPDLAHTPDNLRLLLRVKVCLLPLILTRISEDEPFAADLAWELLENLTRTPLSLLDDTPDNPDFKYEDTTAIAIRIVARELAYSKCATQHPWLAVHLLRIVEMILKLRPLSVSELGAIEELAFRRKEQGETDTIVDSRSWEVALFACCSSQEARFKEAVLRPTGLPVLIKTLEGHLASTIHIDKILWEDVTVTLRSLAFLTEHDWVVDSDVMNERALAAIMGVFRRKIPERRLSLHYWATDTLRNIIARRPEFIRVLVSEGILQVLSRIMPNIASPMLAPISLPPPSPSSPNTPPSGEPERRDDRRRSQGSSSHSPSRLSMADRRNSSVSMFPPDLMTPAQGRLLDDYRRAASVRAEELG